MPEHVPHSPHRHWMSPLSVTLWHLRCYVVVHEEQWVRERFDPNQLDPDDPFEIDAGNRPHLYKHLPTGARGRYVAIGEEDLYDLWMAGPIFDPAKDDGPADWIMIGEVPGLVLVVPVAPANSGDPCKCRPIGIYRAGARERLRWREEA